jgi:hypothetical protein
MGFSDNPLLPEESLGDQETEEAAVHIIPDDQER